jgi:tellurite resistance protein TerC
MNPSQIVYLVFAFVLLLALFLDLGLLSKKGQSISSKTALIQTALWVGLAIAFLGFVWIERGQKPALEYLSAYLMEWSLSIDNVFVFILIFSFFQVKPIYYGRVLLIGILAAILLRIVFITVGIALVARFHWLLYLAGAILVYTGIMMFRAKDDGAKDMEKNRVYKLLRRLLPLTAGDGDGRWRITESGTKKYTTLFVVVVMLAATDIVFAVDSIPAVFGITQDKIVIYTSNIFAVLGLRSLFFLLKDAVTRFRYLPQGIAIVLVFVGLKMLAGIWGFSLPAYLSLLVILVCLGTAILFSVYSTRKKKA